MEDLKIQGYHDVYFIPTVNFDAKTGICELSGESFLEETVKFYSVLIEWLNNYLKENNSLEFIFKLTYFNTSSSKYILEILRLLKSQNDKGKNISVHWHYDKNDVDLEESLEDYIAETELKIMLHPF